MSWAQKAASRPEISTPVFAVSPTRFSVMPMVCSFLQICSLYILHSPNDGAQVGSGSPARPHFPVRHWMPPCVRLKTDSASSALSASSLSLLDVSPATHFRSYAGDLPNA